MRVQRSGELPVRRFSDEVQFAVLVLLLDPSGPGVWSLTELAREVGWEFAVADAVVSLRAAGLVRRVGGVATDWRDVNFATVQLVRCVAIVVQNKLELVATIAVREIGRDDYECPPIPWWRCAGAI